MHLACGCLWPICYHNLWLLVYFYDCWSTYIASAGTNLIKTLQKDDRNGSPQNESCCDVCFENRVIPLSGFNKPCRIFSITLVYYYSNIAYTYNLLKIRFLLKSRPMWLSPSHFWWRSLNIRINGEFNIGHKNNNHVHTHQDTPGLAPSINHLFLCVPSVCAFSTIWKKDKCGQGHEKKRT